MIQRKLRVPPLPALLVERPRVDHLVHALLDRHQVVCVYATAGAGKTTAVVQALRSQPRPVAWLGLDATDAVPGRLLTYLERTLAAAARPCWSS